MKVYLNFVILEHFIKTINFKLPTVLCIISVMHAGNFVMLLYSFARGLAKQSCPLLMTLDSHHI